MFYPTTRFYSPFRSREEFISFLDSQFSNWREALVLAHDFNRNDMYANPGWDYVVVKEGRTPDSVQSWISALSEIEGLISKNWID